MDRNTALDEEIPLAALEWRDPFRQSLLRLAHEDARGLLGDGAAVHEACTFLMARPALEHLFLGLEDGEALALSREIVIGAEAAIACDAEDGEIELQRLIDADDERLSGRAFP